ncbi:MAG: Fe-S cluster assembly protein SufD [Cyclobacteriaceae bacterium]
MNSQVSSATISSVISNAWLASRIVNPTAAEAFTHMGLPHAKHEEYRHTPITRILEKTFDFSIITNPPSAVNDLTPFSIQGVDTNRLVLINGQFSEKHSSVTNTSVEVKSMLRAWVENKQDIVKHLSQYADFRQDALVAWNTAGWMDGIFIKVPDHTEMADPIVIHHIHDASAGEVKTVSRNLILVGSSSKISVIEKFDSTGAHPHFSNVVTEALVEKHATLDFFSLQADTGARYHFGHTQFWQHQASKINNYVFALDGRFIRNNTQMAIDGENCDSHLYGLYLLCNSTLVDNHTVVDHRKPNSFSNELYKGILEDQAKGVFNGKIFVRPDAQKTNAFQSNRNILLSDKATINTKPQLEIWADDVKCSHGCTTGQLDEEAIFYLRSRGISKETARAMVLYAFASELLETITNPVLRNYIDCLISERLHKTF